MDKKKVVTFIDTNIFVVDLRYKDDRNFVTNRAFLDFVASARCKGVTSVYNLLEVCGILSFNLNRQQLKELYYFLPGKYKIEIMPSHSIDASLPAIYTKDILELMYEKSSFGDSLIADFVKKNLSANTIFVSWDTNHFKHLSAAP